MNFAFVRRDEVLNSEEERNVLTALSTMIRKDLEVMYWHNSIVNVFGEFQLFSEQRDELGNFDLLLALTTGESLDEIEHSYLGEAASVCSSNFLDQIITCRKKLSGDDFYVLSEKYTRYLLEVGESHIDGKLFEEYEQITKKYFKKDGSWGWKFHQ